MPVVWRIATEGKTYSASDMSGTGAAKEGGRWNSVGQPMVYTASSIALACLETLVHIKNSLPLNRYLVSVDIPERVWNARLQLADPFPIGWDAEPAGLSSIALGDNWLAARSEAIFQVPSVIVPEEFNYLINPAHPDASTITARKIRKWQYTPRFRNGS